MTKKWKRLWQKEKLLVLSNFFFCHYVFKKPSAAEASESVYMREGVLDTFILYTFIPYILIMFLTNLQGHKFDVFDSFNAQVDTFTF